jgi:hypothetical protein
MGCRSDIEQARLAVATAATNLLNAPCGAKSGPIALVPDD